MKKIMCIYCAKWFDPEEVEMKAIPGDDPRQKYCPKHYPEVLAAHKNLPWNRKF